MQIHKITLNEHRLIFQHDGETPSRAEIPKDSADKPDNETYEQKLERFQNARKAIEKEISETDDPELKQKLQSEYDAFLKEGSQMFKDLQELGVSKEKIIEASLRRLARFTQRTGLEEVENKGSVNISDKETEKGVSLEQASSVEEYAQGKFRDIIDYISKAETLDCSALIGERFDWNFRIYKRGDPEKATLALRRFDASSIADRKQVDAIHNEMIVMIRGLERSIEKRSPILSDDGLSIPEEVQQPEIAKYALEKIGLINDYLNRSTELDYQVSNAGPLDWDFKIYLHDDQYEWSPGVKRELFAYRAVDTSKLFDKNQVDAMYDEMMTMIKSLEGFARLNVESDDAKKKESFKQEMKLSGIEGLIDKNDPNADPFNRFDKLNISQETLNALSGVPEKGIRLIYGHSRMPSFDIYKNGKYASTVDPKNNTRWEEDLVKKVRAALEEK